MDLTISNVHFFKVHFFTSGLANMWSLAVAYPGILFGEGVQQIQLRTEDRENGDLGAVTP